MGRAGHVKRTRQLCTIVILLTTAVYFFSQATTLTFIIQRTGGDANVGQKRNADFEYFSGPSRVPKIPEEHFLKPKFDKKYFIYECTLRPCGGLGDRQEGIVAGYLLAQMLGRRFGVKITIPCDVRNVLMENKSPWIVNDSSLQGLSSVPFEAFDHAAWKLRKDIHKIDLEQRLLQYDVVFFMVNQEFVQYLMKMQRFSVLKWAQHRTVADIYNIVLRRLFKFRPSYQDEFDQFQKSVRADGRKLACAHIRLHNHRKYNYHVDPQVSEYVNTVWSLLKKYNTTKMYRIFVATNSEFVRQEAKRMFPEVIADVDGPIIHVDEERQGSSCEGVAKAHMDQMILSTCDVFIMSDSGFGRVAAMMRGTDDNLYNLAGKASFTDKDFIPSYW